MADNLSFRLATLQDFDEVQEISKGIYEGHDYLPLKYHHWLKQENVIVMVAIKDGKIIGLEAKVIVDNGKTAVSRARRIHPDFRGRSYGKHLSEALGNHVRQIFPNISRQRLTSSFQRDTSRTDYREVLVQHILGSDIDKCQLKNLPKSERSLQVCTREYFAEVILSPAVVKNLFPSKTLVLEWFPFEAEETNIDFILKDGDQIFVDECIDDHLPISFSHGRITPTSEFILWSCSIFTQDPELFQAHLLQQVQTAARFIHGNFRFVSFQQESMVDTGKELLFERAKLTECEYFVKSESSMILYEKDW